MKSVVGRVFLVVYCAAALIPALTFGQTKSQKTKRSTSQSGAVPGAASRSTTLKICQGLPIPDGYMIVGYETSTACPHGAYVLKKQNAPGPGPAATQAPAQVATASASRPRTVSQPGTVSKPGVDLGIGNADDDGTTAVTREPTLQGTYSTTPLDKPMLINSGEAAVKPPAEQKAKRLAKVT
jgi:hypothetical protein